MIEIVMYIFLILFAIAEIGVAAYLIDHFTTIGFPTSHYSAITNFLLFTACWTTFFGIIYVALVATKVLKGSARMATSAIFMTLTFLFWLVAACLYTDPVRGGRGLAMCWGLPALDICRKTQAAQALAWTAFAFSILTAILTCASYRDDRPSPPPPISTTRKEQAV